MKDFTTKEQTKLAQNKSEDNVYKKQLDKFFSGNMPTHEVINVCSTPNILKLLSSKAKKIVLSQKDLNNSLTTKENRSSGHTEGHEIPKQEIYKLSQAIRSPIMVLKGNKRNENSVIILTELLNRYGENIFVPISLDRQNGKISNISTLYGKKNLSNYLLVNVSKILAIDIKKADMLANIGNQYSKFIHDTVVCFDSSIAYTTDNVKHPNEILQYRSSNKSENIRTSTISPEVLKEVIADLSVPPQQKIDMTVNPKFDYVISADRFAQINEKVYGTENNRADTQEKEENAVTKENTEMSNNEQELQKKIQQELTEETNELLHKVKYADIAEINADIIENVENNSIDEYIQNDEKNIEHTEELDIISLLHQSADERNISVDETQKDTKQAENKSTKKRDSHSL